jgi:5'-methylthioinosine phosphorylase
VLAIIGGSGLYALDQSFQIDRSESRQTAYGPVSAELKIGKFHGHELVFLPRHGQSHQIPPHLINYRSNLWALHDLGVKRIIAVNAVGGIDSPPETIVIPDQIIDYSWGREHTFFGSDNSEFGHVDFTYPYNENLRNQIIDAGRIKNIALIDGGTYGCTNGPRLETAAEITRMQKDGCSIIGMTGMPEAGLARELGIDYASISLVVNWCAGIEAEILEMDAIRSTLERGMKMVLSLIHTTLEQDIS